MAGVTSVLKLVWLLLQLVDTFKLLKRPTLTRSRRRSDQSQATDDDNGLTNRPDGRSTTCLKQSKPRQRMSTLKRDQWRRVLKGWVVWVLFQYVEWSSDVTVGLLMPFYGKVKIVVLLSLSIPRHWSLPWIYDSKIYPHLQRYSQKIDLSSGLIALLGQGCLQLVMLVTVAPLLMVYEKVRGLVGARHAFHGRRRSISIPGSTGASARRPPSPSSSPTRTRPTSPHIKLHPSVLQDVVDFSLGSPRTFRKAMGRAKALYDLPAAPRTRGGTKMRLVTDNVARLSKQTANASSEFKTHHPPGRLGCSAATQGQVFDKTREASFLAKLDQLANGGKVAHLPDPRSNEVVDSHPETSVTGSSLPTKRIQDDSQVVVVANGAASPPQTRRTVRSTTGTSVSRSKATLKRKANDPLNETDATNKAVCRLGPAAREEATTGRVRTKRATGRKQTDDDRQRSSSSPPPPPSDKVKTRNPPATKSNKLDRQGKPGVTRTIPEKSPRLPGLPPATRKRQLRSATSKMVTDVGLVVETMDDGWQPQQQRPPRVSRPRTKVMPPHQPIDNHHHIVSTDIKRVKRDLGKPRKPER